MRFSLIFKIIKLVQFSLTTISAIFQFYWLILMLMKWLKCNDITYSTFHINAVGSCNIQYVSVHWNSAFPWLTDPYYSCINIDYWHCQMLCWLSFAMSSLHVVQSCKLRTHIIIDWNYLPYGCLQQSVFVEISICLLQYSHLINVQWVQSMQVFTTSYFD